VPRTRAIEVYNSSIKGLLTEAGEFTFPPDSSKDELNCELFTTGKRRRRKGFDFENNYSLSTFNFPTSSVGQYAISTHVWKTVNGDSSLNFFVFQIGNTLYFYDLASLLLVMGKSLSLLIYLLMLRLVR